MCVIGGLEEHLAHRRLTNLLVLRGDTFIKIKEYCLPLLCCFFGNLPVAVRLASDFSILPDVTWNLRQHDGRRALLLRTRDVLAQIPAVSMNDFHLAGVVGDGLGFFAVSFERAAPAIAGQPAAVIMTELHHHEITRLELLHHFVPAPFDQERPAAASPDSAIYHGNFCRIKMITDQ